MREARNHAAVITFDVRQKLNHQEDVMNPLFEEMKTYKFFILLYLSFGDQKKIQRFLEDELSVPKHCIERDMHLTIYHSRRPPKDYIRKDFNTSIKMDVKETRCMVLAPGGENPRPNLVPGRRSVGVRLTKRNSAIGQILDIRRDAYKHEEIFRNRKNSTDWTNAFGSRHFQPHLKLMRPGNGLDFDLTALGERFRQEFLELEFSKV